LRTLALLFASTGLAFVFVFRFYKQIFPREHGMKKSLWESDWLSLGGVMFA